MTNFSLEKPTSMSIGLRAAFQVSTTGTSLRLSMSWVRGAWVRPVSTSPEGRCARKAETSSASTLGE